MAVGAGQQEGRGAAAPMEALSPEQRGGLVIVVLGGLLAGYVLGRIRRHGWRWSLPAERGDGEPEEAAVRGTPAYQKWLRNQALGLIATCLVAYHVRQFLAEAYGEDLKAAAHWAQ